MNCPHYIYIYIYVHTISIYICIYHYHVLWCDVSTLPSHGLWLWVDNHNSLDDHPVATTFFLINHPTICSSFIHLYLFINHSLLGSINQLW